MVMQLLVHVKHCHNNAIILKLKYNFHTIAVITIFSHRVDVCLLCLSVKTSNFRNPLAYSI